jgi:NAD(P)-dependent dehydrogenase (short-subunit alcohol dehydrogenase family)
MPQNPTAIDPAMILRVVDTNVVGVLRVTNACLPLLRQSAHPGSASSRAASGR